MSSTFLPSPAAYQNLQDNCIVPQLLLLERDPTTNDRYTVGTYATNTVSRSSFQLDAYVSGSPVWVALGGGATAGIITINDIYPNGAGNFTLTAGSGITLTPGTNSLTIAASGASFSVGTFGSTPNADGLSLTGSVLNMQPADASNPGGVSTTTQSFVGAKTFTTSMGSPVILANGSSSGVISILPQAAAGTYNFNLPTTAGSSGQALLSAGGGSSPMTWGSVLSSISLTGDSGGALSGTSFTFTGGTTGLTFAGSGTTLTLGGDLVVANGGTGTNSFTAFAPVIGGATTTAALHSAGTGISNSGYVLTSTGSGSAPTFQAVPISSFPFTDEGSSFLANVSNGYFISGAATATLVGIPSQGNQIVFLVDTSGSFVIRANTGQTIRIGTATSTVAGTATNSAQGDGLTLTYRASDSTWIASGVQGTWTTA